MFHLTKPRTVTEMRKHLSCTEDEAFRNLEKAAQNLLKNARWANYGTKITELQIPLVQLRLVRKAHK